MYITLASDSTRIESTSHLTIKLNKDQSVDLQRCISLFGSSSFSTLPAPISIRMACFNIERKGDKLNRIEGKNVVAGIHDFDLEMSELCILNTKSVHVAVSNLTIANILSTTHLDVCMDTNKSTRHISVDMSDADLTWVRNNQYCSISHLYSLNSHSLT